MSKPKRTWFTLVQHSAWVARQEPRFKNMTEQAGIATLAELGRVVDAGGLLFNDYMQADDASDKVNHPELPGGEKPQPPRFHQTFTIGGRALYLPPDAS